MATLAFFEIKYHDDMAELSSVRVVTSTYLQNTRMRLPEKGARPRILKFKTIFLRIGRIINYLCTKVGGVGWSFRFGPSHFLNEYMICCSRTVNTI